MSFELLGDDGVVRVIRKKPTGGFTIDFPGWWTLKSNKHLVLDVDLGNRRTWDGVPNLPGPQSNCETARLRAIYEVKPDVESEKLNVWTGRVVSDMESVTLCN